MSRTYRAPAPLHAVGFTTAAFLVAATLIPLVAAYGEPDEAACATSRTRCPEIADVAGDVLLSQLAGQADLDGPALVAGTPFDVVDLRSGYVPLESADAFALKIHVQGMPSTWRLDSRDRAGLADTLLDAAVDDSVFDDALTYTAYFNVQGHEYRAVASLAEVDVTLVSHSAMSDAIQGVQTARITFHQAQDELTKVAPLPAQAQQALTDADKALDDALTMLQACEDLACAPEPMQQAIEDAIAAVSDARKAVRTAVDPIAGAADDVPVPTIPAVGFAGAGDPIDAPEVPDEVRALLSSAADLLSDIPVEDLGGHKLLFERYILYDDSTGTAAAIPGALDPGAGTVAFFLFKKQVGSPQARAGDRLTGFAIESAAHGNIADFAPQDGLDHSYAFQYDAVKPGGSGSGTGGPSGGSGAAGSGNAPVVSEVQVAIAGAATRSLVPGGVATYIVTIANPGTTASRGIVSLSPAADGWTHQAVPLHWDLAPGATKEIRVSVSALKGAAHDQVTKVFLGPEGGQTTTKEFTTTLETAAKEQASKGFPWLLAGGIAAVLAAAGIATTVVLMRRK